IIATISSNSAYIVGTPSTATLNIADDPPIVSISGVGNTTEGGDPGYVTFSRTGGDINSALPVTYTVGGTATSGTDYTALSGTVTFPAGSNTVNENISALRDNLVEGDETVILTISGDGTTYLTSDPTTDTVTIADDPAIISVSRVNDGKEGSTDGHFQITRTGGDSTQALTVSYSPSGTAIAGTDYATLSGTATIPANATSVTVTIDCSDFTAATVTKTVTLSLGSTSNYVPGNSSDTLFIQAKVSTSEYYWTGADGQSWMDPKSWVYADHVTIPTAAPGANDTVIFDNGYALTDAHLSGPIVGGYSVEEMDMHSGYYYRATLSFPLVVGSLFMNGGTIDQPGDSIYGSDLAVTSAALWTGGTINSTANLANLTFSGATATITPAAGGLSIGDNLNITNNSDVITSDGVINFANTANVNADSGGTNDIRIRTSAGLKYNNVKQINVTTDGRFWVGGPGTFDSGGTPCTNNGGWVWAHDSATIHFGGQIQIDNTTSLFSYFQDGADSTTDVQNGSTLQVDSGMQVANGLFKTSGSSNASLNTGTVKGDFTLSGGTLKICIVGDTSKYGIFEVTGVVKVSGGTYSPFIDGTKTGVCDVWYSNKAFSIDPGSDDSATLAPLGSAGDNTVANGIWKIIRSDVGVTGSFKTTNLKYTDTKSYSTTTFDNPVKGFGLSTAS